MRLIAYFFVDFLKSSWRGCKYFEANGAKFFRAKINHRVLSRLPNRKKSGNSSKRYHYITESHNPISKLHSRMPSRKRRQVSFTSL
jgi:hypothetical protein